MRSGIIDAGSKQNDVWGILAGSWNEFDRNGWHVVMTPFFLVMTRTCEAGGNPLPFRFKDVVCGLAYKSDGSASAVIVRPGENSINMSDKCIVKFTLFGEEASTEAVI
jgi:hypothetical protein